MSRRIIIAEVICEDELEDPGAAREGLESVYFRVNYIQNSPWSKDFEYIQRNADESSA